MRYTMPEGADAAETTDGQRGGLMSSIDVAAPESLLYNHPVRSLWAAPRRLAVR